MGRINRKRKNQLGFAIICCVFVCSCNFNARPLKTESSQSTFVDTIATTDSVIDVINYRDTLRKVYNSYIGVTEATGNNDGPEIKKFLASCGLPEGNYWCTAFVYSCFLEAGLEPDVKSPAWSPSWFSDSTKVVYVRGNSNFGFVAKPGMVGGSFFKSKGRIAHGYFIDHEDKNNFYCVDGNGNSRGSNNGGEVLKVVRSKSLVYKISDYIND